MTVPVGFPSQRTSSGAVNASVWWRHRALQWLQKAAMIVFQAMVTGLYVLCDTCNLYFYILYYLSYWYTWICMFIILFVLLGHVWSVCLSCYLSYWDTCDLYVSYIICPTGTGVICMIPILFVQWDTCDLYVSYTICPIGTHVICVFLMFASQAWPLKHIKCTPRKVSWHFDTKNNIIISIWYLVVPVGQSGDMWFRCRYRAVLYITILHTKWQSKWNITSVMGLVESIIKMSAEHCKSFINIHLLQSQRG